MFITLFSYFSTAAWVGRECILGQAILQIIKSTKILPPPDLVVVHVEIVRGGEDGDEAGEPRGLAFPVHSVPATGTFTFVMESE